MSQGPHELTDLERLAMERDSAIATAKQLNGELKAVKFDRDRFEAAAKQVLKTLDSEITKNGELTKAKNGAYWERTQLVAALSKLFPASLDRHQGGGWDDDWRWIVLILLPTGQASWHIHDSELNEFAHLKSFNGVIWDGHTTQEKYDRLRQLPWMRATNPVWTGNLGCNVERRHAGLDYPRTCSLCKLGPCKLGHK